MDRDLLGLFFLAHWRMTNLLFKVLGAQPNTSYMQSINCRRQGDAISLSKKLQAVTYRDKSVCDRGKSERVKVSRGALTFFLQGVSMMWTWQSTVLSFLFFSPFCLAPQ